VRILLDTHSFLWFIAGNPRCSIFARELITDPTNQAYISIASLWENSIKISLGKLSLAIPFEELLSQQLTSNSIDTLPIELAELELIARLPFHHRDPFDRLLVAQSLIRNFPLVSADENLDRYGVQRLW